MAERKLDNSTVIPGAAPNSGSVENKPTISPIVTGAVVVPKKKSVASKLRETFIGEDVGNIKNYIIWEVVVPSIRNALLSTFHGCTDMLFGGGKKSGYGGYNPYIGYQNPYIQYSQPRYGYQSPIVSNPMQPSTPTPIPQPPRNSRDVGKILFKTRADAELVAETLQGGILATYGCACVRDLYELVGGVELQATDNNWGWRDLSSMNVRAVPEGYLLELPAPIYLN